MASDIDDILKEFDRTGEQFFSREEFIEKLKTGKKLRIKYGVDVTAPTLHLGHAVNLWLMRTMQNYGHKIIFLIGDYTTRIGDPDGKLEARPEISREDIDKNAELFIEQAKMVLRFDNPDLLEIRRNSEWLDKMSLQDFLDLAKQVTHAKLISRDMFQTRIREKKDIYMHEMLYPILQGWDSVAIRADLTIIGSDQLFNEMMGRFFQEKQGDKPQTIITTKITPGIDGKAKQSKSLGNYIGLGHDARDKFARVMRIPDTLIDEYFRIYTDIPLMDIERMSDDIVRHPMKEKLAYAIVGRYHGHEAAIAEQKYFEETFAQKKVPDDIPTLGVLTPHIKVLDLVALAHPLKSKSHARRLITQGAVELNDDKLQAPDDMVLVKTNDILRIGKREWFRIEIIHLNSFESERLIMTPMQVEDIDFFAKDLAEWDIVKYLGQKAGKKDLERRQREILERVIGKPEPKDEWLWKVTLKSNPRQVIGVAHLTRDSKIGNENIWFKKEFRDQNLATEALDAISSHAFEILGFSSLVFRNAFAFASNEAELEHMQSVFMSLDANMRSRETPDGVWGFTFDVWQMMKRQLSNLISPDMLVILGPTFVKEHHQRLQKVRDAIKLTHEQRKALGELLDHEEELDVQKAMEKSAPPPPDGQKPPPKRPSRHFKPQNNT